MLKFASKNLSEIAKLVNGEVQGNKDLTLERLAASPEDSTQDDLVIIYDEKYLKDLKKIKAKAFILPITFKDKISDLNAAVIWVARPRFAFKKLIDLLSKSRLFPKAGVHPSSVIDSLSKIAKNSCIGPNVFIGPDSSVGEDTVIFPNVYIGQGVVIGSKCTVYPNCSILDGSKIGNNVILHSGVVVGADGYSYVTSEDSNLEKAKKGNFNFNLGRQIQYKIQSVGNVIIEDDVEIGANSCIDRGTVGNTVIGEGTKIDNLVQVAHNCKIGKDCLIVGQVGLAGSINIGNRVVVGGQCGFADNIDIGDDVIFVARSGVHGNIPSNSVYMGMPAVPYMEYFKNEKTMRRLPKKTEKLEEQVKLLEVKVKELENKLSVGV